MVKMKSSDLVDNEVADSEYAHVAELARMLKSEDVVDLLTVACILELQRGHDPELLEVSFDDAVERAGIIKSLMVGSYV